MRTILVLLVVSGILLFGCFGSGGGAANVGGTGASATGGAGGGAASNGSLGGAGAGTGTGTGGGTVDLTSKTWAELITLGVPVECDISYLLNGNRTTFKAYMKGDSEIRYEVPSQTPDSTCSKAVMILKGDTAYYGCGAGTLFGPTSSCQWMTFEVNNTSSGAASAEPPDVDTLPQVQMNCIPWVYDSSKFVPTGKACTMSEIMAEYQQ